MSRVLLILVVINLVTVEINSARILAIFPTPSVSHQVAFQPVINELINRGHEIVVITTNPQYSKSKCPVNLTEIDTHDVSYKLWKQILLDEVMGVEEDVVDQIFTTYLGLVKVFNEQLKLDVVKDIIFKRKGEFDLLITEAVARPALAFSHIYKIPLIQIGSLGPVFFNDQIIGALSHPILYPFPWHRKVYNLTTLERMRNLWHHYKFQYNFNNYIAEYENDVIRTHFGPGVLPVNELCDNIQMLILNVHPMWIDNQPVPSNMIFMNGIHLKPAKELPKDLKSYLDSSKNGTIYVSFGSNVVPSAIQNMDLLLKTLSQIPYDVLLKWDHDKLPIEAKNIRVSKWLPQTDLLRHPKIKLFITQGGLQSLDEAMMSGVPLIGIPLFADQWYNVDKFVRHKIGIRLDIEDLTEEGLTDAIDTIIKDKSYRENIVRLNTLMNDQPQPPLQRVVWWIEHVLRHGSAAHLKAPTANMTLAQYIQIDLIIMALCAICAILTVIVYVIYTIRKILMRHNILKVKKH